MKQNTLDFIFILKWVCLQSSRHIQYFSACFSVNSVSITFNVNNFTISHSYVLHVEFMHVSKRTELQLSSSHKNILKYLMSSFILTSFESPTQQLMPHNFIINIMIFRTQYQSHAIKMNMSEVTERPPSPSTNIIN